MSGMLRFGLALAALSVLAFAQEQLEVSQPEPGTIRVGDSARVTIRVEGASANPRAPELPAVDGLRMRLLGPSRNSYTFYDGRRLIERVGVQYIVELQPTRAGIFEVPSFPIWTGSKQQDTPSLRLEARADLVGAELGYLEVEVAPRRVYVHEPVRVRLDYGVQRGVKLADAVADRYRYQDIEVRASWLDEFPAGERLEVADPAGETRIAVCNGALIRAGYDSAHDRDGEPWQQYSFDRAFLPTRLGRLKLPAPMLRFRVLSGRVRTDRFGRPLGQGAENYFVYGEPIELEVLPIPEEGRPTPYFGAVGRFTFTADLDRPQVRVGESVKLTLTVRGRGNFEFLRLPELDELEGFHKLGANEAQRDATRVVVTYDLTPLSPEVSGIPSIGWNYFDTTPGVEDFVEVVTSPLPLDVQPLANGEALAPVLGADVRAVTPGVDDIFDLPPLDGPPALRRELPSWVAGIAALGPWLMALGLLRWRRARRLAAADVAGQRARGARRAFEQALQRGEHALDALAAYLGDRLDVAAPAVISSELASMLIDRGLAEPLARDVAAAIEKGTHARYGGGETLAVDDARALVEQLEGRSLSNRPASTLALGLLALALLGAGGDLRAQQGDQGQIDPVQAYRRGDYAAADAGFQAAYQRTSDHRLLRSRGNCQFRLGHYARARWLFERARLGLPRDAELQANLRVVSKRLDLPVEARGLGADLRGVLDRLRPLERVSLCSGAMLAAALSLLFGWRRLALRWLGAALLVPGVILVVDAVWLAPSKPLMAVALDELRVTAEPREGMDAVATVRPGVMLPLGGGASGSFVRVEVNGRVGYAQRDLIGVVE